MFGTWMYQLWFGRYSRARGVLDSSAFEHVFVGEEKNGEVSGLHNWVRFFTLENNATEKFDYQGFIVKRGGVMTTIRFNWKGLPKKSGSLMIGTSPEFDMALYTMCFLSRRGKETCQVEVNGCPVSVTSYDMVQNGKAYIGTVYPTAGPQNMLHVVLMAMILGQAVLAAEKIPAFSVTDTELKEMSKKLRDADENKASRGQIQVNFQGHTSTRDTSDNAPRRFFDKVDGRLLEKPSYKQFLALADNFNRHTGTTEPRVSVAEVRFAEPHSSLGLFRLKVHSRHEVMARHVKISCGQPKAQSPLHSGWYSTHSKTLLEQQAMQWNRISARMYCKHLKGQRWQRSLLQKRTSLIQEKRETSTFLTTVLESKPWKVLYRYLNQKGHPFAVSPLVFRYWIAQLWFVHYSRARGRADTSGFEHIFMGEEKNNEISGLHNWLRFYTLEKNATEHFDYKGFIIKRGNVMASLKFMWGDDLKRSGSLLIGTSPEYEMALYTLCFLARRGRDQCEVEIDGCPLLITSFDIVQNNKVFIGSIFPTAGRLTEKCRRLARRA
ncbi:unnamed protein product [Haemonchus placei]|uniref:EndoU domain-containing protein n=1 Tax=Haemonchus placei TaxID=6290 RepID=A0A3P7WF75_HAEPC|nr:unnamed protein product [Haemonchus placei]